MFKKKDNVWDFMHGWGVVTDIDVTSDTPVIAKFGKIIVRYSVDGKREADNINPTLFKKKIDYQIYSELSDLALFLSRNLRIKKFEQAWHNLTIYFEKADNRYYIQRWHEEEDPNKLYFTQPGITKVVLMLNECKIPPEVLNSAFKELGWI